MATPTDRPYAGYRYPAEVIATAVWLYLRFPLRLRIVEEMLTTRGIFVSHETVRQWGLKFGRDRLTRRQEIAQLCKIFIRSFLTVLYHLCIVPCQNPPVSCMQLQPRDQGARFSGDQRGSRFVRAIEMVFTPLA